MKNNKRRFCATMMMMMMMTMKWKCCRGRETKEKIKEIGFFSADGPSNGCFDEMDVVGLVLRFYAP